MRSSLDFLTFSKLEIASWALEAVVANVLPFPATARLKGLFPCADLPSVYQEAKVLV